ncbi:hypothetical protein MRS76_03240 [Rhizobiaceae bacterium n13]|nr:hypothetical protein [Fererhizobium litorale]MDI7860960.1 hypothetical protein [Fererhizobium litorale]
MFLDSYQLINDIRWGKLDDFGGDATAAMAEAKRRLELAVQVFGSSQSIRSNVGRTMRRLRSDFAVTPEDLAKIKSMDDEKFMSLILSTGGDPKKMKEMANPGFLRKALDEVSFSMRNGLLWNYPTHLINMTGNVLMQVARPLEKQIGSLVMGSRGSPIRQQATKEYYYTVASITDGLKAGLDAFMNGDSGLSPHTTEWLESSGSLATQHQRLGLPNFRPINDFADLWHNLNLSSLYRNVGGLPTRALGAQDEFFKTLRYRAVVQAKAAMDAERLGLEGQGFKDFMEDRLKRAFDADGRAVDREALQEAQTVTFNQELLQGTLGAGLRNLRGQYPAMGLVVPFLKTPVNVLRYAHKYTPVLNLAQTEFRQMISGKMGAEAQAQAIGQMAIGSMFMAFSAMMAANGRFTGGGPSDPQLRQQLAATGWKPYSVRIKNDDGSTTFVPYGRLDPAGMVMSIAADLHHLYTVDPENRDIADLATASAMALARNFGERSFLLNLNQLFGALSDPENRMEAYVGNMGAAMLPGSSAMRGYMNTDPYLRDARSLMDRALKDVPGYGDSLPPRRDAFGEPLAKKLGLTSTATLDLVEEEHNRMMVETGRGLLLPNPVKDGVDFRDITLPDGRNAYDVLQEFSGFPPSGPSLKEALEELIKSDEYQDMADGDAGTKGTRLNALAGVVQKYRAAGYKRLIFTFPMFRKLALEKQARATAEFLSRRTGDEGAGERLLKSLGY